MLRGFGFTYSLARASIRGWFVGPDGVKRWADNNEPCEKAQPSIEDSNKKPPTNEGDTHETRNNATRNHP